MSVDLHIHTNYSDGKNSPQEIVEQALQIGLQAIAITDHETLEGINEALETGQKLGLEVIPGVEISAIWGEHNVHILGYWLDLQSPVLRAKLAFWQQKRLERAAQMVAKLQKLKIKITMEQVLALAGRGSVGRPHIAKALLELGVVSSYAEAFSYYLGQHKIAYVPRCPITPEEAVSLIKTTGGAAVMAHPGLANCDGILPSLLSAGLVGLEVDHPSHTPAQRQHYRKLAQQYHLIETAGSDYHGLGQRESVLLGQERADYQVVLALQKVCK